MNYKMFEENPDVLSQKTVIELLEPHLDDLVGCVRHGWGQWMRLREIAPALCKPLDPTARAILVYQYMVESAKRMFHDVDGVTHSEQDKYLRLAFYGKVVVRFKKLDDSLCSRGIPTHQRLDFTRQICIEGFERTNLIVGYRLDESQTKIFDVNMICPINERRNLWAYELESHLETQTYFEAIPVGTEEPAKVSVKGTKKRIGNVS